VWNRPARLHYLHRPVAQRTDEATRPPATAIQQTPSPLASGTPGPGTPVPGRMACATVGFVRDR
jgi:hypothetical protein